MDDTTSIGPALDDLRTAGATIAVDRLSTAFGQALRAATENERYFVCASALGADRTKADAALRSVQGVWAGSSPTVVEYQAATQRLAAGE